jgi:hypothetical protein
MDEICDMLNNVSTLNQEEEWELLKKTLEEMSLLYNLFTNTQDLFINVNIMLDKIYNLFRRYKLSFVDDMNNEDYEHAFGIKHGINSYICNYEYMKQSKNINTYRIMYAIAKSVINLIIKTIDNSYSSDEESMDSWG